MLVWDSVSGELQLKLKGHRLPVNEMVFSKDGHQLLTAGQDQSVRLWDSASGALIRAFEAGREEFVSASINGDSSLVVGAAAGSSGELYLWDAESWLPPSPTHPIATSSSMLP